MQLRNLVIVNDFNYIQGGASKVAINTAEIMLKLGVNVYFFSAVNKEEANLVGVKYISTNQQECLKDSNKLRGTMNGLYNWKSRKKLKELLKTLNPEETIIHVHGWTKALSCSVFQIAFKLKFKVVLTFHDYFTACPNGGYYNYNVNEICPLKPLSFSCVKTNCDSRNYFFKIYRVIREFIQNKIVQLPKKLQYGISISNLNEKVLKETLQKTKFTRINNPINVLYLKERIHPSKSDSYIYVGRISKEKGVEIFCNAITKLQLKGIVIGEGEEKEKLKEKYPNLDFVGWKTEKEVWEYMKNARALIFPSKWYEGAPLTILEAQAMGLPVISSNSCSGVEYVYPSLIFDIKNYRSLKEKILELQNDEEIEKISENLYHKWNRDYVKEYKENLTNLYEQILEDKR